MKYTHLKAQDACLAAVGALLVAFLVAPLLALLLSTSSVDFRAGLARPLVWQALRLSLLTTSVSLLLVTLLGTPLAWWLAQRNSRLTRTLETLVQLPSVIPPAVAGIALLLAFGRRGIFSSLLPNAASLSFTTSAVVMAEVFVSAPFYVQAALSAFRRLDPKILIVARSLGATPFRLFARVVVPLSASGLAAGAAMSWARSLGEFGATLMFAGNLEGRTQTLPLAIYAALESDLRAAQAISIVLVAVALGLLVCVRTLTNRAQKADSAQEHPL